MQNKPHKANQPTFKLPTLIGCGDKRNKGIPTQPTFADIEQVLRISSCFLQIKKQAIFARSLVRIRLIQLIFRLAMILCGALWAPQKSYASVTVGDLSQLQSEIVFLQAKLKQADLQAELSAKNQRKLSPEANQLPAVKAVYGVGNKRYATLLYDSGAVLDAKLGDSIPGGFSVVAISVDRVLLSKGKQRVIVGFATTTKAPPATSIPLSNSQSFGPSTALPPALQYP